MPSDPNTEGWGSIAVFVKLQKQTSGLIHINEKPLWIVNIHFPLPESDKWNCCKYLCKIVNKIVGNDPFIIAGDFNTFYDEDGKKQVQYLLDNLPKDTRDCTEKLITSQKYSEILGTFIGTSYDRFKQTPPNLSHLDHIFVNGISTNKYATVETETMLDEECDELTQRDLLPSDHLPVKINIKL